MTFCFQRMKITLKIPLQDLFKVRVDVNLQDYQGATPLHRAKTVESLEVCLLVCCALRQSMVEIKSIIL